MNFVSLSILRIQNIRFWINFCGLKTGGASKDTRRMIYLRRAGNHASIARSGDRAGNYCRLNALLFSSKVCSRNSPIPDPVCGQGIATLRLRPRHSGTPKILPGCIFLCFTSSASESLLSCFLLVPPAIKSQTAMNGNT